MTTDTLDYAAFVDTAMRGMVREVLKRVERGGLPGAHHFFISFRTDHPGVTMSDMLRSKYPQEITIVLQHQYWDLNVEQERFKVALSFNNIPEKLIVPFAALTGFADPSTKFGLQFHNEQHEQSGSKPSLSAPVLPTVTPEDEESGKEGAQIITLDAFRKK